MNSKQDESIISKFKKLNQQIISSFGPFSEEFTSHDKFLKFRELLIHQNQKLNTCIKQLQMDLTKQVDDKVLKMIGQFFEICQLQLKMALFHMTFSGNRSFKNQPIKLEANDIFCEFRSDELFAFQEKIKLEKLRINEKLDELINETELENLNESKLCSKDDESVLNRTKNNEFNDNFPNDLLISKTNTSNNEFMQILSNKNTSNKVLSNGKRIKSSHLQKTQTKLIVETGDSFHESKPQNEGHLQNHKIEQSKKSKPINIKKLKEETFSGNDCECECHEIMKMISKKMSLGNPERIFFEESVDPNHQKPILNLQECTKVDQTTRLIEAFEQGDFLAIRAEKDPVVLAEVSQQLLFKIFDDKSHIVSKIEMFFQSVKDVKTRTDNFARSKQILTKIITENYGVSRHFNDAIVTEAFVKELNLEQFSEHIQDEFGKGFRKLFETVFKKMKQIKEEQLKENSTMTLLNSDTMDQTKQLLIDKLTETEHRLNDLSIKYAHLEMEVFDRRTRLDQSEAKANRLSAFFEEQNTKIENLNEEIEIQTTYIQLLNKDQTKDDKNQELKMKNAIVETIRTIGQSHILIDNALQRTMPNSDLGSLLEFINDKLQSQDIVGTLETHLNILIDQVNSFDRKNTQIERIDLIKNGLRNLPLLAEDKSIWDDIQFPKKKRESQKSSRFFKQKMLDTTQIANEPKRTSNLKTKNRENQAVQKTKANKHKKEQIEEIIDAKKLLNKLRTKKSGMKESRSPLKKEGDGNQIINAKSTKILKKTSNGNSQKILSNAKREELSKMINEEVETCKIITNSNENNNLSNEHSVFQVDESSKKIGLKQEIDSNEKTINSKPIVIFDNSEKEEKKQIQKTSNQIVINDTVETDFEKIGNEINNPKVGDILMGNLDLEMNNENTVVKENEPANIYDELYFEKNSLKNLTKSNILGEENAKKEPNYLISKEKQNREEDFSFRNELILKNETDIKFHFENGTCEKKESKNLKVINSNILNFKIQENENEIKINQKWEHQLNEFPKQPNSKTKIRSYENENNKNDDLTNYLKENHSVEKIQNPQKNSKKLVLKLKNALNEEKLMDEKMSIKESKKSPGIKTNEIKVGQIQADSKPNTSVEETAIIDLINNFVHWKNNSILRKNNIDRILNIFKMLNNEKQAKFIILILSKTQTEEFELLKNQSQNNKSSFKIELQKLNSTFENEKEFFQKEFEKLTKETQNELRGFNKKSSVFLPKNGAWKTKDHKRENFFGVISGNCALHLNKQENQTKLDLIPNPSRKTWNHKKQRSVLPIQAIRTEQSVEKQKQLINVTQNNTKIENSAIATYEGYHNELQTKNNGFRDSRLFKAPNFFHEMCHNPKSDHLINQRTTYNDNLADFATQQNNENLFLVKKQDQQDQKMI